MQVEGIHGGASEAETGVLIQWKDLAGFESTWEPFMTNKKQFTVKAMKQNLGN